MAHIIIYINISYNIFFPLNFESNVSFILGWSALNFYKIVHYIFVLSLSLSISHNMYFRKWVKRKWASKRERRHRRLWIFFILVIWKGWWRRGRGMFKKNHKLISVNGDVVPRKLACERRIMYGSVILCALENAADAEHSSELHGGGSGRGLCQEYGRLFKIVTARNADSFILHNCVFL